MAQTDGHPDLQTDLGDWFNENLGSTQSMHLCIEQNPEGAYVQSVPAHKAIIFN